MTVLQNPNATTPCNDCTYNRSGELLYQCDFHAGKQYTYSVQHFNPDAVPSEEQQYFVMSHYGKKVCACKTLEKALSMVTQYFEQWYGEREFWIVLAKGAVDARRPITWYQIVTFRGADGREYCRKCLKAVNA